jgi:hypothetical protein
MVGGLVAMRETNKLRGDHLHIEPHLPRQSASALLNHSPADDQANEAEEDDEQIPVIFLRFPWV